MSSIIVERDLPITMDDGVTLRADVFRPTKDGRYPVILSYGPYGKNLHFGKGYPDQWKSLVEKYPEALQGTSGKYLNWETVDPEKWVPDGYVVVRVDSRGAGRSPGVLDILSPRETKDLYLCIEWAAKQPWSNGKVGLAGISYYAMNQWVVAAMQPPHLAAICPWEGAADFYRDMTYHGGIPSLHFWKVWYDGQVKMVQHGVGKRGHVDDLTGELVAGPETLSDKELAKKRVNLIEAIKAHPLDDEFHRARSPDWSKVKVPVLSCGNWGGFGLHLRGNTEGFLRAASKEKWLEIHGREHWAEFYTDYGIALQKRFFDYYLKGIDNGWKETPKVLLWIRHVDGTYKLRAENEWPIKWTRWTKLYLNPADCSLQKRPKKKEQSIEYGALDDGLTFMTEPLREQTEITGPLAAKLFISSSINDADLFLTLRAFSPDMREVYFYDYLDPHTPLSHGWLRCSHRKLDPKLSKKWRPYHIHDKIEPLKPGQVYEVDVELWPTCVVLPAGYRLALTIRGKDYDYGGPPVKTGPFLMKGTGPFLHDYITENYKVKVYGGGKRASYILLPIVPPKKVDPETEKVSWLIKLMKEKR